MSKGKHLLIDCQFPAKSEICLDDDKWAKALSKAAETAGAKVVSQSRYHFGHNSPPGFAVVIMLDESHCSAHSYADNGLIALDIFTCGKTDPRRVFSILQEEISFDSYVIYEMDRFIDEC